MACKHHHHDHHNHQNQRSLALSFVLIFSFMLVEALAGVFTNSLALLADAGHMANDAFSLSLAFLAIWLSTHLEKCSRWLTLVNGLSLVLVAGFILFEAVERLFSPETFLPLPMIGVATVGLIVNIIVARLLHGGDLHNLNMQAAYWHVLADLFGSVITILAGLCAYFWQWQWVDPVASAILSLVILKSGASITRQAYGKI